MLAVHEVAGPEPAGAGLPEFTKDGVQLPFGIAIQRKSGKIVREHVG